MSFTSAKPTPRCRRISSSIAAYSAGKPTLSRPTARRCTRPESAGSTTLTDTYSVVSEPMIMTWVCTAASAKPS